METSVAKLEVCGNCRHFKAGASFVDPVQKTSYTQGGCLLAEHYREKIQLPAGLSLTTRFYNQVNDFDYPLCGGSFEASDPGLGLIVSSYDPVSGIRELTNRLGAATETTIPVAECLHALKSIRKSDHPDRENLAQALISQIDKTAAGSMKVDASRDDYGCEGRPGRLFETATQWVPHWSDALGKMHGRWRCVHCGKTPITRHIATGHDHTDSSVDACDCAGAVATGKMAP